MTNQMIIEAHLLRFLEETEQDKNISLWGLMAFCIGYYGKIDGDIMKAIRDVYYTGHCLPVEQAEGIDFIWPED